MAMLARNGVNLYYETHGEGPVILLTHGYSATSQMWQGQIDAAVEEAQAVIPGTCAVTARATIPRIRPLTARARRSRTWRRCWTLSARRQAIVGGLSLGGYMSLAFAATHPDRVKALLIIDTGPGFKKDEARDGWNATSLKTAERYEKDGLRPARQRERGTGDGAPSRRHRPGRARRAACSRRRMRA